MELPTGALSFAPNTKGLKILTPSGYQDFAGVAFMGDKPVVRINLSNSGYIECTLNHRLYLMDGSEMLAGELEPGMELFTAEEDPVSVLDICDTGEVKAVFDVIDVQGGHVYYTDDVLSHNCKFVSEDETLINNMVLANLTSQDPEFKIGDVRWFSEPIPNHVHGFTLDPSMGTGGDFSAIQIFDLTTMTQVGEWLNNKVDSQGQVDILRKSMLYVYHTLKNSPHQQGEPDIYWTVENNSLGESALNIIDMIGEDRFPGIFVHEPRSSGGGSKRKGLNTNTRTKTTACAKFKTLVETRRLTVKSRPLLIQMKNFVRGGGSYKGKIGTHDDLVMGVLQIVRLLMICSNWEEDIEQQMQSIVDSFDEGDDEPLPMVF